MGQRFQIRYGRFNRVLLTLLAAGKRNSYVEVGDGSVTARMGPSFRGNFPLSSVTSCRRLPYVWWAYGVHGWHGRWIVNGSGHNMVSVKIDPPVKARVLGFPCRLDDLWISLEDPEGFCAAVGR